jgi:ATP adenylyltransferase
MEIYLRPGTLWPAAVNRSRHAIGCGAMQPIATEQTLVEDGGIRFVLRKVSSLARKEEEKRLRKADESRADNPFLPYEQDLFVAHVSDRHIALLNKFNVIDQHLLIVTREFEHQEMLLNSRDFAALAACMREVDGLGFYNGGEMAGASQSHKHLQLVPLPLGEGTPSVPMEEAFEALRGGPGINQVPGLGFRSAFSWLESEEFDDPLGAGEKLCSLYLKLLEASEIWGIPSEGGLRQSAPYNVLLTRRWMLLVPRSRESADSVSVNSLGFAGSLFVRNEQQLDLVKRLGPLGVLGRVAVH